MVLLTNENKKSVRVEFLDKLISSLEEDKFEQNFKEIKENFLRNINLQQFFQRKQSTWFYCKRFRFW